jgi:hypothetical protein
VFQSIEDIATWGSWYKLYDGAVGSTNQTRLPQVSWENRILLGSSPRATLHLSQLAQFESVTKELGRAMQVVLMRFDLRIQIAIRAHLTAATLLPGKGLECGSRDRRWHP